VQQHLATVGSRAAARIIDAVVVVAFSGAVAVLTGGVGDVPGWIRYATVGFGVAYEGLLVAGSGRTLGKRVAGVRVVDARTGAVPGLGRSLVRAAPYLLALVPVVGAFWSLVYVTAVWRPRRQGWHDSAAGTIVVTTAPAPAAGGYPSS
jgi:uncharacterized RDD family membrane protein YckC